ncbi:MAG: RDD family protein [Bacilli bacterium]
MKANSYKRVLAYLVDIMIISFVSLLLTYFVPTSENYNKLNKEFENLTIDYRNQEVTMEEYLEKGTDINYQLNKEGVPQTIVSTVLSIIYFVVLAYFMNGETLGKKLMKIKITSNNDKKLTMNNYLIRALVIDSVLMNIITIITILLFSKDIYLTSYNIISYVFSFVYIVSLAMILFSKNGRGLQDILANTKVISTETVEEKQEVLEKEKITKKDPKIEDAEIIAK